MARTLHATRLQTFCIRSSTVEVRHAPRSESWFSFLDRDLLGRSSQGIVHDLARFVHNRVQVFLTLQAFRVNLVQVLGPGWAGREPSAGSHYLQSANPSVISWSAGKARTYTLSS